MMTIPVLVQAMAYSSMNVDVLQSCHADCPSPFFFFFFFFFVSHDLSSVYVRFISLQSVIL